MGLPNFRAKSIIDFVPGLFWSQKQITQTNNTKGIHIFQRSFYDHIIRNEDDYQKIWNYIEVNPAKWKEDK